MVSLTESELIAAVREDLRDLMGIDAAPETVVIKRWDKAIPQYRLGHAGIIDAIERFERECPGLYVAGNFRGGISVGDCIMSAKKLSECVASYLSKQTREPRVG
jgi:oxygen-dependent protoporphyrinogen oxidase